MSGSSGGGYIPPQRTAFDCETGVIMVNVSSVDLNVLSKCKVRDILNVDINEKGTLVVNDGNGEILGAILHPNTQDIIDCIQNGNTYNAEVVVINFPACKIKISRSK